MDLWEAVRRERLAVADLLDGLDDEQWSTPSLCDAWTVKDVAAHLLGLPEGGAAGLARAVVRAGGSVSRATQTEVRRRASREPADLVASLRSHAGSRVAPPVLGPAAELTEVLVHRLDVAVPLGLEPGGSPESWEAVLGFVTSRLAVVGFRRPGLPPLAEVTGRPPYVALAAMGRPAGLAHLDGPGLRALAAWVRAGNGNADVGTGR